METRTLLKYLPEFLFRLNHGPGRDVKMFVGPRKPETVRCVGMLLVLLVNHGASLHAKLGLPTTFLAKVRYGVRWGLKVLVSDRQLKTPQSRLIGPLVHVV